MRKVHKLKIDLQVTDYKLPMNAHIVQFCEDGQGELCIWYVFPCPSEFCTEVEYVHRSLRIFGTGHDVPDGYMFVGTAICGRLVWHLFEGNA